MLALFLLSRFFGCTMGTFIFLWCYFVAVFWATQITTTNWSALGCYYVSRDSLLFQGLSTVGRTVVRNVSFVYDVSFLLFAVGVCFRGWLLGTSPW